MTSDPPTPVLETPENELAIGAGRPGPGRPPGSRNKVGEAVRKSFAQGVEQHADEFWQWLREIKSPARRCELYLRAAEFHVPKLTRSAVALETVEPPERPQTLADFYRQMNFVGGAEDVYATNENPNALRRVAGRADA